MVLTAETRELEKYIEDIWQFLPIPVCYINAVHLIIAVGANFEKFSGYDSEELVGMELETLFADQQEIKKIEEEILNSGFVSNIVTTFITKEKMKFRFFSATARKDEEDNIFGYFMSMRYHQAQAIRTSLKRK